jgi:competence protein ComEA
MKLNIVFVLFSLFFSSVTFAGYPVNINTASAEEIAEGLDGIGLKKAQAIVDYRTQAGLFQSADDLVNIKGIGEKTIEKNRNNVLTQDASENAVAAE